MVYNETKQNKFLKYFSFSNRFLSQIIGEKDRKILQTEGKIIKIT